MWREGGREGVPDCGEEYIACVIVTVYHNHNHNHNHNYNASTESVMAT